TADYSRVLDTNKGKILVCANSETYTRMQRAVPLPVRRQAITSEGYAYGTTHIRIRGNRTSIREGNEWTFLICIYPELEDINKFIRFCIASQIFYKKHNIPLQWMGQPGGVVRYLYSFHGTGSFRGYDE